MPGGALSDASWVESEAGHTPASEARFLHLARATVLTVLLSYSALQAIWLLAFPVPPRGLDLAADIAAMLALLALTIWVTSVETGHWPAWQRWLVLLTEGLLTYLPVSIFGQLPSEGAAYLAGSALLLLSPWVGGALFAAVVASVVVTALALVACGYEAAYSALATLVFGLVMFVLPRLTRLIACARAGWRDAAAFAVINERMRFARDLHDLFGYSLSAISLKTEFARQLAGTEPERARDELAEVLDIARSALTDMRTVASGPHHLSLTREASSAASLLAAAGIDVRVDIDCGTPGKLFDTTFATALRELVTNVLRHSQARHCVITGSTDRGIMTLRVANDGVPRSVASPAGGNGMGNLAARMAALDGTLSVRVSHDGWFEVLAQAPLAFRPADEDATASQAAPAGAAETVTADFAVGRRPGGCKGQRSRGPRLGLK